MAELTAAQKMVKARTALVLDQFFWGSLTLKLTMQEDAKKQTAATNGVLIKYNPAFIDKQNLDQTKGLWCHEILHCALGHHTRRNGRDANTYNEACDYAINPMVLEAGMVLPEGALINPDFKDMSVDQIYSILWGKKQQEQADNAEQQKNEQGTSEDAEQEQGSDEDEQEDEDGQSDDSGSNPGGSNPNSGDPGGCGEVEDYEGEDGQGATESDNAEQQQEWQIAVTQAAQQAKSRGTLPGGIAKLIEKLNEPKVNWKEALHRFITQIARDDYTFRRINTRFVGRGICLPSLYNEKLPPIDMCIDISGSVSEEELAQFASEVDDILTNHNTTLRVSYVDTEVQSTQEFTQEDLPVVLKAEIGGGTDFAPGIKHAMEQDEQPVCLIYLTDMCCSSFGPEPDFPVLWVCTQSNIPDYYSAPPFGELIKMK